MKPRKRGPIFRSVMRSRLSFDDGYAERPIYVMKANTTEKEKGVDMIELIKQNFGLSKLDLDNGLKKATEEAMIPTKVHKSLEKKQVKFTRDEKGNLASPFRSKKKLE